MGAFGAHANLSPMPRRLDLFRRVVLLLLLMALPIQGAFAVSRSLCAVGAADASVESVAAHVHAAATGAGHRHDGATAGNAHHHNQATQPRDDSSDAADATPSPNTHPASDTCRMCAACCLTVATAPASQVLAAVPTVAAVFPAVTTAVPHPSADGPERPPRTL